MIAKRPPSPPQPAASPFSGARDPAGPSDSATCAPLLTRHQTRLSSSSPATRTPPSWPSPLAGSGRRPPLWTASRCCTTTTCCSPSPRWPPPWSQRLASRLGSSCRPCRVGLSATTFTRYLAKARLTAGSHENPCENLVLVIFYLLFVRTGEWILRSPRLVPVRPEPAAVLSYPSVLPGQPSRRRPHAPRSRVFSWRRRSDTAAGQAEPASYEKKIEPAETQEQRQQRQFHLSFRLVASFST